MLLEEVTTELARRTGRVTKGKKRRKEAQAKPALVCEANHGLPLKVAVG